MTNYLSEELEYEWSLVRKTPYSQKFMVTVDGLRGLKAIFDIHYARSVYVTVCFIGYKSSFTDGLTHWLFFDLEKIIKRHSSYKVLDYTLVFCDRLFGGNFAIPDDGMC